MALPKYLTELKDDPRVEDVVDERDCDQGYWVYLKRGLINSDDGIHFIHEMTVKNVRAKMSKLNIVPCQCGHCIDTHR